MKIFRSLFITLCCLAAISISCGGSDDDGGSAPIDNNPPTNNDNNNGDQGNDNEGNNGGNPPTTPTNPDPSNPVNNNSPQAAQLVFPLRDEVCNAGIFVSDTESDVEFRWQPAQNADRYTVVLTNLTNNAVQELEANENRLVIRLLQDQSYSWSIISRANNSTNTAQSAVWRLYNAARGIQNYAPFPANVQAPSNGTTLASTTTTLNLVWEGNDPDNDIDLFEVFLGEDPSVLSSLGTTSQMTLATPILNADTTYYWKIISSDTFGNRTESQTFSFINP